MLNDRQQQLVNVAQKMVDELPGGDRFTVASAAADSAGKIHTGINLRHFAGGPCAELVCLANAAAANAAQAGPADAAQASTTRAGHLTTIVAVGDQDRGVIPPCGRCRQILLDLHPGISVVVPGAGGELRAVAVSDLLPYNYVSPEPTPAQVHPLTPSEASMIASDERLA